MLAVGMFFLGGSSREATPEKPALGQSEANEVDQTKPLAKGKLLERLEERLVALGAKLVRSLGLFF